MGVGSPRLPASGPELAPVPFSRFRVVRDLGFGAQGIVHEVIDLERDTRLALKTLRSIGAEEIVRLKTEFRAVRDLRHPNLVRLGELIEDEGRWLFTMELVDGVDLLAYVRGEGALDASTSWPTRVESGPRARVAAATAAGPMGGAPLVVVSPDARPRPTFDEARLRAALAQLAAAIAFLHREGKAHCDVKPSNVLVNRSGRVVLIDFGVVSEFAALEAEEEAVVGTVPYVAPEQVLGARIGPAADWYAAGVLLFEALTGKRPFEGEPHDVLKRKCVVNPFAPSEIAPGVPPDLDALCLRMLAREPAARAGDAEVLRALGVDEGSPELARPLFVGRERELAALQAALAASRDGASVWIFLEGESGVGKSALAQRFVEEARHDDARVLVLEGRCHEQERVPYNAFDAMLDGLARFLRGRSDATRAVLLPPDVERLRFVFPALGKLRETREPSEAGERETGRSRAERDEAFATLRELLRRVGLRRTLILVVEDIQWADADSLALLEALTEVPSAPRMLLVATARLRPDGSPCAALAAVRGALQRVPIGGLETGDAERFLGHLLAQRGEVAPSDAASILQSSRGHPMFLEELVRYLARPRAATGAATLDDAVCARADELDPVTRSVLQFIATAGQPTPQAVIADAAGVPLAAYAESAAILRAGRLVRAQGTRLEDPVEPYHDRVREAVYANLEPAARAEIHAALGAALERRGASAELMFPHFAAAGDAARAAGYAELAAAAAAKALAFDRAAALYRSALAGGPADSARRRRLLVLLGQSLVDAGRSQEAASCFLEASPLAAPDEELRLELLRRAAEQFLVSGHLSPGLEALRVVLGAFGLSLPTSRFLALARLGWYQLRLGARSLTWTARKAAEVEPSAAARIDLCWSVGAGLGLVDSLRSMLFIQLGVLLALEQGDEARLARGLSAAAAGEAGLGRRAQAARLGEACTRAAAGTGTDRDRFYAQLATFTYRFFLENDWRGCLDGTREAGRLWRGGGRTEGWEIDLVDQFACWSLDNLGRFRDLGARVPAKIRAAQRAGNRFIEVNFRTQFVNLHLAADSPDEARRDVLDAIASWPRVDDEFGNQDYLALRNLTYVAMYAGDTAELTRKLPAWKDYFASLLSRVVFLRQDALFWTGGAALVLARASRGNASERARHVRTAERAVAGLARFELPMAAAYALQLRAGIAACQGNEERTRDALTKALAHADAHGTELHAACLRARLGALLDGDEGGALRATAEAWMNAEGVRAPARMVNAVLPGSGRSSE